MHIKAMMRGLDMGLTHCNFFPAMANSGSWIRPIGAPNYAAIAKADQAAGLMRA